MGYFDKYLMHEDGRDKGMNSTSSEKGTDGKKNNTSEYNHQYYMKNKDKWRDNKSVQGGVSYHEYDENDPDQDSKWFKEENRLFPNRDLFAYQKPDGSWVLLEEDMCWKVPPGVKKEDLKAAIDAFEKTPESELVEYGNDHGFSKYITDHINKSVKNGGEKEFDVDAAARDVIRGKYGNGAERKAALGDDYAEVQKRVNEILGGKTSSEPKKTSKNTSKPVDGPKETPHANFPSSNSTSSAPRAREKNVTGTGTGLYRRDKVEDNKPRKREKNVTGNGTGLYTRGKVAHSEFVDQSESLEHHGILGQKWGVRRFEKAGGGLTAAGKARYQTDSNGNYKKIGNSGGSTSSSKSRKAEYKAKYNTYSKKYDEWSKKQDQNDSEWNKVQEMRKGLGKTGLTRTINAARNKSDAAKAYNKAYDKWSKTQDKLDKEWGEVKDSKPSRLTDKQKKALKIGAAVTATTLATYGLYKLNKKATEGIKNYENIKADDAFKAASKMRDAYALNMRVAADHFNNGDRRSSEVMRKSADNMWEKAKEFYALGDEHVRKAAQKSYSIKDKVDYLKDKNVQEYTAELLKKNQATLSSLGF